MGRDAVQSQEVQVLGLKKGRVTCKFSLQVQGEVIPSIKDNPINCLGKWFNALLRDGANVAETVKQTGEWLKKIDKSLLPSKIKTWLYQHGLCPGSSGSSLSTSSP